VALKQHNKEPTKGSWHTNLGTRLTFTATMQFWSWAAAARKERLDSWADPQQKVTDCAQHCLGHCCWRKAPAYH